MKKLLTILAFLVFFGPLVGCEVAPFISPVVTGVIIWVEGEAHKFYPYDADVVYRAAKRAAANMGLEITKDELRNNVQHYLILGTKDRFKVRIENAKEDISELRVRINFMGDKNYAELFYAKVDDELSKVRFNENGEPMFDP
jgi:hypothetical protein